MSASYTRALLLSPILLTAGLAACSHGQPADTPAPAAAPVAADTPGLVGPVWQLVEFRGSDDSRLTLDDPAKYTIEFKGDGSVSARIDCNRGRGTWKSSGPSLELGPLATTRAACPPGSLYDQIVKQWPYVRSYVMKDGHLFLALMADGGIYEYAPAFGAAPSPGAAAGTVTLENTYWKVIEVGGQPARVADNIPEPHLLLHPDQKQASGSTGCNRFSGTYELSGDSLRFNPLAATLRACLDADLNRQESAFLQALGATRTWRVTGDTLVLSGEAGPVAQLAAQYMK